MNPYKRILSVFVAAGALFIFGTAHAVTTDIPDLYPSIMRGVRPLGMGNAFLAMPGTDNIAQFYNPAAINDFEAVRRYSVGAPMIDLNSDALSASFGLLDLKHNMKSGMPSSQKLDMFNSFTREHIGQFDGVLTSMPLFQVRHKYYSLSAVGDYRSILSFRNVAFPNFDYKLRIATGLVGGSAYGFFDDALQIGGNLKVLYRMGREDEVTSADILVNTIEKLIGFESWKRGIGFGIDVGMKYRLPILEDVLAPTVAVVVQDAGNTYFTGGAPMMPMSVSAGLGVFPKVGKVALAFLADFRELNEREDFLNKFHFGAEAVFPEVKKLGITFSVRAGCNEGYPAAGLTAKMPVMSYLFAFYGEETGDYTNSKPSYRFANQLSFDF